MIQPIAWLRLMLCLLLLALPVGCGKKPSGVLPPEGVPEGLFPRGYPPRDPPGPVIPPAQDRLEDPAGTDDAP